MDKLYSYTDGYKARSWFMLNDDVKAGETTGTCFGYEPNKIGALCHTITADNEDGVAASYGHMLNWYTKEDWAESAGKLSKFPGINLGNLLDHTTSQGAILRPFFSRESDIIERAG
jgi:hypothetical protein